MIAYLRAISNRADDVSVRRILNVPKRGIGDRAEAAVAELATRLRISFGEALRRVDEIPGLASRSVRLTRLRGASRPARRNGGRRGPRRSDPDQRAGEVRLPGRAQDLCRPAGSDRLENLVELVAVAQEFVTGVAAAEVEPELYSEFGVLDHDRSALSTPIAEDRPSEDLELAAGAPEPDTSLGAFLERVALVADSDQIPTASDSADSGVVTLMTLHTAKGLEFDNVFLTGCEDGVFPHQRALSNPDELEEERRLAYVGITRARQHLYVSRAVVRAAWGAPQHNPQPLSQRDSRSAHRLATHGARGEHLAQHLGDLRPSAVAQHCRFRRRPAAGAAHPQPGGR